ncbi:IS1 family transposase [Mesorhizobium sp.]|uniref:IS1 family transposase n=1 Tax=Mesorhizobium sp. TaxID=1871066 RepID=UPI0025BC8052|nr:IS1 family transposase [Mesorhizobium sp.]
MNKLPLKTRVQILTMLCEGSSMRSISRVADVSINTVSKLLVDAGKFCADLHDREVRNVTSKRIQCDEIWSFVGAKAKNVSTMKQPVEGAGDVWTWTALDSDSKLIVSWLVGGRDGEYALAFIDDVKDRLANRVQLTTDGHRAYLNAFEEAFGADIDYAMLIKQYGEKTSPERRYSPAVCTGANRRFTRLTNAFSKKFDNHVHMVAIYTVWYNFIKMHKTLKMTPAMAAGVSQTLWSMEDLCEKMDAVASKPGKRGPYKKHDA